MGKHKHFKFMGFLNISGEAEIHTIPKTCGKWISIVREKCRKTQTFQSYGFLKYFEWHRNPYNSQNMEKVDFHSTGKVRQNTKNFKFMGFLNISAEAEIHTIPKTWEKWISIVREKYGKTQTFQIYGFLKYFGLSRSIKIQIYRKSNSHSKRKIWENTNI